MSPLIFMLQIKFHHQKNEQYYIVDLLLIRWYIPKFCMNKYEYKERLWITFATEIYKCGHVINTVSANCNPKSLNKNNNPPLTVELSCLIRHADPN